MEQFTAVLDGFLSPTESVRKEAESYFKELKTNNPEQALTLLLEILGNEALKADASPTTQTRRQQAAVAMRLLLRELISGEKEASIWVKLSETGKARFKSDMIAFAVSEPNQVVQQSIGDIITDVGGVLLRQNEWPALEEATFQMVGNQNSEAVQILGLNLCATLEPCFSDKIVKNAAQLGSMFAEKLKWPANGVKVAALGFLFQIVCNERRSVWKQFEAFVPEMAAVLRALGADEVANNDTTSLNELVKKMIEIAELCPEYFKANLGLILNEMIALGGNQDLSEDTRLVCCEFLLLMVEIKPKLCSKVPNFLSNLAGLLITLMLDIEEDREWLERELTCEDDEESRLYDMGEFGIDRLARSIDGDIIMPIIFAHVLQQVQIDDWKHKCAGILAVSQSVEYLPEDKVETDLKGIVELLVSQISGKPVGADSTSPSPTNMTSPNLSQHYRVRFAACRALGQVALDHQPFVQETFHATVLPAVIASMNDPVARVQAQAFACFVNFAEEVDSEDLLPYVPTVMAAILARMDMGFKLPEASISQLSPDGSPQFSPEAVARMYRSIREQCITATAVIGGVLSKQFMPYCTQIVPLMKIIVEQCTDVADRQLRGRALECLSIIAFSVGRAPLEAECTQIVAALIALYEQDLAVDDPVHDYVHEALRRMVKVLGADFAAPEFQFLPKILEKMLPKFEVKAEVLASDDDSHDDYSLFCTNAGEISGVRTSRIELIEQELQLLLVLAENCKGAFAPHAFACMDKINALVQLKHSDSVRQRSLSVIAELIAAAKAGGASTETVTQRVFAVCAHVFATVTDEEEAALSGVSHLTANMAGMARCLEGAGDIPISSEQIADLIHKTFELIDKSFERRREIAEAKREPDMDEEDVDRFEEEADLEQIFRETCLRTLEAILKNHPTAFLSSAAPGEVVKFVTATTEAAYNAAVSNSGNSPQSQASPQSQSDMKEQEEDASLGVFVLCDLIENLQIQGLQLVHTLVPRVIAFAQAKDATLRQASCFCLALMMKLPALDAALVSQVLNVFSNVVNAPDANAKDNKSATENAVAGLVHTTLSQMLPGSPLAEKAPLLAGLCLSHLPLVSDDQEAQKIHEALATALLSSPSHVFWGENASHSPQISRIFAAIYKTHLSNDATDAKVLNLFKTSIPKETLANVIHSTTNLTPAEKRGLLKLERDASA